jgi:MraZ protein
VFLGEFIHTLDGKGRVVMPRSFRDFLEEGLVTTKGKDGNVVVFPYDTFRQLAQEELESARTRAARRKARSMFSGADLMKLDSQGRILLKPELQEYAGIDDSKEVAVVGLFDRIEIWDVATFEAEREAADADYRANEEEPGF